MTRGKLQGQKGHNTWSNIRIPFREFIASDGLEINGRGWML